MKFKIKGTKTFSEIVEAEDQESAEMLFVDRHHPYLDKIQEVIKLEGRKEKDWLVLSWPSSLFSLSMITAIGQSLKANFFRIKYLELSSLS
jgi:hypothetical protein